MLQMSGSGLVAPCGGLFNEQYKKFGVNIVKDEKEVLSKSNIIVQLALLSEEKLSLIKENQTLIGVFNPNGNKDKIEKLIKKNINLFSLEFLPRITRAQSMDILSSQANLAGYKAVVESFSFFEKAIWTYALLSGFPTVCISFWIPSF